MNSRTAWKTAFRLSWPSFWLTLLYSAVVLPPFAVLIMFSGEANLPFAFLLFFTAMGTLLWKCVAGYLDDGMRLAPDVFINGVLPMISGKEPKPQHIKSGKARWRAIRDMMRERFTAFSFAALLGSVIVTGTKQPLLALLYLPLWLLMDVYFFRQMLQRKERKPGSPEVSADTLKGFENFNRWQGGGWQRPFKIAVVWPVVLFLLLWVAYPLAGGLITFPTDPEVTAFFAPDDKIAPEKNGIYGILALGSKTEDGKAIAEQLKEGKKLAPIAATFPDGPTPVCRTDIKPPDGQTCVTLSKTGKLLEANKELLARYEQLYQYDTFAWPADIASAGMDYEDYYINGMTDTGLLEVVSYLHKAQAGAPEAALKDWMRHTAFLGKLLVSRETLRAYAYNKLVYAEAIAALPYILSKDPQLAKKYRDDIRKSFAYLGPKDIDMVAIIQNEARITAWSAETQIESAFSQLKSLAPENAPPLLRKATAIAFNGSAKVLDDKLYWLTREMEQLAREDRDDAKTVHDRLEGIEQRYSTHNGRLLHGVADLAMPHISAVVNLLLSPLPQTFAVVLFDTADYNRQRMMRAYVESVAAGTKPAGMNDFLKAAPKDIDPQLAEQATGEAFYWDKTAGKICYGDAPAPETHRAKQTHCLETSSFVE